MNATPSDFNDQDSEGCATSPCGGAGQAHRPDLPPGKTGLGVGASTAAPNSSSLDVTDDMRQAALAIRPKDSPTARGLITGPWSRLEQDALRGRTNPYGPDGLKFPRRRRTDVEEGYWRVSDGWPSQGFIGLDANDGGVPWRVPSVVRPVGKGRPVEVGEQYPETLSAETWLTRNDQDYKLQSQGWKEIRRGSGVYRTPREHEPILSSVALEQQMGDRSLGRKRAGKGWVALPHRDDSYESPRLHPIIERCNRETRERTRAEHKIRCDLFPHETHRRPRKLHCTPVVGIEELLVQYVETPGNGRAKQRARARLSKAVREAAILWDWKHPEPLAEHLRIEKLTKEALARYHGVSSHTVDALTNRLEVVMMRDSEMPMLIERVASLEVFRAEAARQLRIPESDLAVRAAIERVISECYAATGDPESW